MTDLRAGLLLVGLTLSSPALGGPRRPPAPAPSFAVADVAAPEARFCGFEVTAAPDADRPACQAAAGRMPCSPQSAPSGGEVTDDLDGDGESDLLLSRRPHDGSATFGGTYLRRGEGYLLVDFQALDPKADPAQPQVVQAGSPPLLRDGYDIAGEEASLSVARLRRWDGARLRTLLWFCANRQAGARQAHNRVELSDVDRDGRKEVVLSGSLRPVVLRMAPDGLSLQVDAALTERHISDSPGERRAQALRKEAKALAAAGHLRRAADLLERALSQSPEQVELQIELAALLLRTGAAERAVTILSQARDKAPEQALVHCGLAEAYRKLDDDDELAALQRCLELNPKFDDPARRAALEDRLRALTPKAQ